MHIAYSYGLYTWNLQTPVFGLELRPREKVDHSDDGNPHTLTVKSYCGSISWLLPQKIADHKFCFPYHRSVRGEFA